MNKRYIDFVPTKQQKQPVVEKKEPVKKAPVVLVSKKVESRAVVLEPKAKEDEVQLGVVEELGTRVNRESTDVEKPVEKPQAKTSKVFSLPKTPFINQEKVVKRPLSKNVYRKEVVVPKEEPKGPVTIIAKPEKDAHVSMVVAVIITIILGAAAGTVAFLLLPK